MDRAHRLAFQQVLEGIRANSNLPVNLSRWPLNNRDAEQLAEALRGNQSVAILELSAALSYFDGSGPILKTLVPVLQTSGVTNLHLGNNSIDAKGVAFLVSCLKGSLVWRLNLSQNRVRDDGAAAVAAALQDLPVTELSLFENGITKRGVRALAGALQRSAVTSLSLAGNDLQNAGVDALSQVLASSPHLTELDLRGCQIEDGGIMSLALALHESRLTALDVDDNIFGDEGARVLAGALQESYLETLFVANANFTDESHRAFVEGARDTAVTELHLGEEVLDEILTELELVLEVNRTRTFLLQMKVEGDGSEWLFTFRTIAGNVAAVLHWSVFKAARDLPEAVFRAMHSSGFGLPTRHLRTRHLRLVKPDGELLDVGENAVNLALQLQRPEAE